MAAEIYPYHEPVPQFSDSDSYELVVRSQAGALELLTSLGALGEIREAVLGHCKEHRPMPPYRPQLLKARLRIHGWMSEVRVPPLDPAFDDAAINERYDMLKFFAADGDEVGVAIEMDNWMVHRDLLKFRRGFGRGQSAVGVIIQPNYRETYYCYEHFRLLNERSSARSRFSIAAREGPA